MPNFTKAQRRALLALPADGSWLIKPAGGIAPAINSLIFYHRDLVLDQFGSYGPRGGNCRRACLTPAGVEARKALEAGQ